MAELHPSNASEVAAAPGARANPGSPPDHSLAPPKRRSRRGLFLLIVLGSGALALGGYRGWDRYQGRREWRAAEDAIHRREFATAATHLDRYVALRPDDPAGWFRAARTARRRGHFADAKRYLAESERLGGATDATRLERDLRLIQQGELGESDARLRATIDPDHPDVLLILEALARGYMTAERWADARQACDLWRALQSDHPWPWLWSGWISERLNRVDQATDFFRRAVELDPADRDARVSLARVLLRRRQPGAALEHCEWILARTPDDADALLGLAECRLEAGRAGDAVPLIDQVLKRNPAPAAAVPLRGRAAMAEGDLASAERLFRQAVRAEPSDAEVLHALVVCLRAQRKDAEADRLGHQLEELQRDLRRLTELVPTITPQLTDAGPCYEAGVIAIRIGRAQQGVNLLHEALRRKGDHRAIHAALAAHYRRAERPDLARVHQNLSETP